MYLIYYESHLTVILYSNYHYYFYFIFILLYLLCYGAFEYIYIEFAPWKSINYYCYYYKLLLLRLLQLWAKWRNDDTYVCELNNSTDNKRLKPKAMYVYSETEVGCYFHSVLLFLLIYLKVSFLTFLDITIEYLERQGCRHWYGWMFTVSRSDDYFSIFCRVIWGLKNIRKCLLLVALLIPLLLYHRYWRGSRWYPWVHQRFGNNCKYS